MWSIFLHNLCKLQRYSHIRKIVNFCGNFCAHSHSISGTILGHAAKNLENLFQGRQQLRHLWATFGKLQWKNGNNAATGVHFTINFAVVGI